jgi:hypothetical protein
MQCAGCPTLAAFLSLRLGWESTMPGITETVKMPWKDYDHARFKDNSLPT